ncbi:hypothetical protein DL770_010148 [Monosporascus sp. CRB-9-2]|nr:hypothetical protein DL770_010148 [Monosporascus sp. CRB-9-2]
MAYLLRPNDDFFLELRERHIVAEQLQHSPEQLYQYAQLKDRQIRLLEVLPDDLKSHRILCRIHEHAMSDLPQYEALSYAWGTGPINRRIVITEGGFFRRLDVKECLYSALWRLRHDSKSRFLWVDAICINQENMAERSSQVRIMREIYTRCLRVVIWLGEKSGHSEEALDLVQTINEVKEYDAMNGILRNLLAQDPRDDRLPIGYSRIWHDFFGLLKRPWFKRAWIVQELATAPNATIVCGTRQLRWDEFRSAVLYIGEIAGTGLLPAALAIHEIQLFTNLGQMRHNFQQGYQFNALEVLLCSTHSLATDRRDYIFAFHGLLPSGSQDSSITTPEYRIKGSSDGTESPEFIEECVELYTNRAIRLLENHQNLDLLSVTSVTRKSAISKTSGQTSGLNSGRSIEHPEIPHTHYVMMAASSCSRVTPWTKLASSARSSLVFQKGLTIVVHYSPLPSFASAFNYKGVFSPPS